jgi:hypothetical protein
MKTAYRPDQYNRICSQVKEQIRKLGADSKQFSWTQGEILKKRQDLFADIPKYPRSLSVELNGYFDCTFDRITKEQISFLYRVEGKFYTLSHSPRPDLPTWKDLPDAPTIDLSNCGGLYWEHSLKLFY